MGEAPPRSVQVRFIQKLQKELACPSDVREYAVSKQWVAALQQFIEDGTESTEHKVPSLSCSDWDGDNMYVGEKSWRVLASWYGMDSNYSFRRRSTISSYISIQVHTSSGGMPQSSGGYVLADNKLDFLTIYCCLLKDLSSECLKQPYLNIFFWESLDYIEFQLRCALKVHPEKVVRMWLSLCDDGVDVLLEDLSLYDQQSSSVGAVICQKYSDVLSVLQKRQAQPSSNLPHAVAGALPVKEELSTVFVANQWQLTLCLEVLPSPGAAQPLPHNYSVTTGVIPAVFQNLPLDHLFSGEAPKSSTWDDQLKQLLDESVSDFSQLIIEQRDKVQVRTEQLLKSAKESYQSLEQQCKMKMEEVSQLEDRLNAREKELNERDHEINSKLAKFKSMLTEFLTKKERFEKEAAQLAEQNRITASKVELNVGGVRYTTSLATLLKEQGSQLQVMFSGQHALQPDGDGSYFIDRDGTHFRYILNFLRDGPASLQHLPPHDLRLVSELRTEAEFYQLHRMADALRIRMTEGSGAKGDYVSLPS